MAGLSRGGHYVRDLGFTRLPVVDASDAGELVKISVADRTFEVQSNNIILTDPWVIELRHTFMRRQQRKKIEGGGWHEVPTRGVALQLTNPALEESVKKARADEKQRQKEEQDRRDAEAREAAKQQFLSQLTGEFVGKKLTKINAGVGELQLEFEGGARMSVVLHGDDLYNAGVAVNRVDLGSFETID